MHIKPTQKKERKELIIYTILRTRNKYLYLVAMYISKERNVN